MRAMVLDLLNDIVYAADTHGLVESPSGDGRWGGLGFDSDARACLVGSITACDYTSYCGCIKRIIMHNPLAHLVSHYVLAAAACKGNCMFHKQQVQSVDGQNWQHPLGSALNSTAIEI